MVILRALGSKIVMECIDLQTGLGLCFHAVLTVPLSQMMVVQALFRETIVDCFQTIGLQNKILMLPLLAMLR